ncbi:hypothetical protein [Streptomyces sp. NBC_01689]|uniref:hypothetical protein n=1 Tax=Streptomyces sp. NBC_01689 TaxID=2975911 RepID=UPI002E2FAE72|nr:hypothetical protein [Streptomyces sp. NBC_01689]
MTGSPEHKRAGDGQEVPQWLEDAAHDRLAAETYARVHAAEDAAAVVDRLRDGMARPHPVVSAHRRPHPLRRFVLRLETVLAVTLLLPAILADHAHYAITRRLTHRLQPVLYRVDSYLFRLEIRLTESGDHRFVHGVGLWIAQAVDGLDTLLARVGLSR